MQVLEQTGLLATPRTLLAHCVWLDDIEIQLLADHGNWGTHNPVDNETCVWGRANRRHANKELQVELNYRWPKRENNNLDMFEELKTASFS